MSAVQKTINATEIEAFRVAGDTINLLADAQTTANKYESFEVFAAQTSGPPPHTHVWSEFYYIVEGELDLTVDGITTRLSAGSFAHVKEGAIHAHRVISEKARFVFIASPGGVSEFFRDIDRETQGSTNDIAKCMMVAERHGFIIKGAL